MVAPRDTFTGVGVGRKAGSEAGEAICWGHFWFPGDLASVVGGTCSTSDRQSAVIRADK